MRDERILQTLKELEDLENQPDLEEGLWRISFETGMLFNVLLRHSGATRILEIGTSSGYSTLFLAEAARANGGKVTTCEMSEFKIKLARDVFAKAGLAEHIELMEGNALEKIEELEGPWDFVFLDGMKDEYAFYLASLWPKVRPGGLVVADNMLSHKGYMGIEAYKFTVDLLDDATSVTVPIGSGDHFTCKLEEQVEEEEDGE
ncbi:class I SAM-dependent methyltransferase [Tumebacillus sp. ITR2]|uniref:Class I SAM-dependent methyltransferase n=1 Tax=Tumebacillus amylolyticus TaxID=2801339 RepID=A0ABS1JE38_9BACL|nr:class I SAM-dependent methyltransferase [Tumebacillus amylolyticus]MBL0388536.1 class I SAM-dependent methyltransferase [Tumebacillus amylolyticus]